VENFRQFSLAASLYLFTFLLSSNFRLDSNPNQQESGLHEKKDFDVRKSGVKCPEMLPKCPKMLVKMRITRQVTDFTRKIKFQCEKRSTARVYESEVFPLLRTG
jgi:hypothetical protein